MGNSDQRISSSAEKNNHPDSLVSVSPQKSSSSAKRNENFEELQDFHINDEYTSIFTRSTVETLLMQYLNPAANIGRTGTIFQSSSTVRQKDISCHTTYAPQNVSTNFNLENFSKKKLPLLSPAIKDIDVLRLLFENQRMQSFVTNSNFILFQR